MDSQIVVAAVLVSLAQSAVGYPTGAPLSVCGNMQPAGHKNKTTDVLIPAEAVAAPFEFTVPTSVEVGKSFEVKITSKNGTEYEGVFIQARAVDCNGTQTAQVAIGTWIQLPGYLKTLACNEADNSAVTQSVKVHNASETLRHVAATEGRFIIRATFVKEYDEYWENVISEVISTKNANQCPGGGGAATRAPEVMESTTSAAPLRTLSSAAALFGVFSLLRWI